MGTGTTARRLLVALALLAGLGLLAWALGVGRAPETASETAPTPRRQGPSRRLIAGPAGGAATLPERAPATGPVGAAVGRATSAPARAPVGARAASAARADAAAPAPLWRLEGPAPTGAVGPDGEPEPAARRLRLDPDLPARLAVGDDFAVATPDLGALSATVSAVRLHPNGDLGLSAVLTDFDETYLVTLTRGRGALFARVATPAGIWVVEGTGAGAVIRPDPWHRLVDPARTDERVAPVDPSAVEDAT